MTTAHKHHKRALTLNVLNRMRMIHLNMCHLYSQHTQYLWSQYLQRQSTLCLSVCKTCFVHCPFIIDFYHLLYLLVWYIVQGYIQNVSQWIYSFFYFAQCSRIHLVAHKQYLQSVCRFSLLLVLVLCKYNSHSNLINKCTRNLFFIPSLHFVEPTHLAHTQSKKSILMNYWVCQNKLKQDKEHKLCWYL